MKYLLTLTLLSLSVFGQTIQPTPVRALTFDNITTTTIIDNRSIVNRQITYASIACTGSGSWSVSLQYGSTSTGSWISYGSSATVTNASSPGIAFGFLYTPPNFMRILFNSGTPICKFSGTQTLYLSTASGSVSYPISIANGGTGATNASDALTNLGIPTPFSIANGGTGASDATTALSNLGLAIPIAVNKGGTGSTTASGARTNLGITLPVPLTDGGTNATTAAGARTNLGLNLTGIYSGDGTTPTAVASSTKLQYLRNQANVAGTQYQFANMERLVTSDFYWNTSSGIGVSGSLSSSGANTLTLTPCPLGVDGASLGAFTTLWGTWSSDRRLTSIVDAGSTATITFETPHGLTASSAIIISGVGTGGGANLNGQFTILTTPTTTTLTITTSGVTDGTYTPTGSDAGMSVSSATGTQNERLDSIVDSANTATVTFLYPHGIANGSKIRITGIVTSGGKFLNGVFTVASVPSDRTLTYTTSGVTDATYVPCTGTGCGTPTVDVAMGVSSPNHYIRITDSGTPANTENVLITGGTCYSGATSGTITLTTANSHTTWTIGSATGGVQEAIKYVEGLTNGGAVTTPFGNTTTYAPITIKGSVPIAIHGQGFWNSQIYMDPTFTSGDLFRCISRVQLIGFFNLYLSTSSSHSSGAAIHLAANSQTSVVLNNVRVENTYIGIWLEENGGVTALDFQYSQTASNPVAYAGIRVSSGGSSNIVFIGGGIHNAENATSAIIDYGVLVEAADGVLFEGMDIRGETGILVYGAADSQIGTVLFYNNIIDRCPNHNIEVTTIGVPYLFNNIWFVGNHILGHPTMNDYELIYGNLSSYAPNWIGLVIQGNIIGNGNKDNIRLFTPRGTIISNNQIINANGKGSGGSGIVVSDATDLIIANNAIQDIRGTPAQQYGVLFYGTNSYVSMTGNMAKGNTAGAYQIDSSATFSNSILNPNIGADTLIPTLASTGSLVLPGTLAETYFVTGTTTINTIAGPISNGYKIYFICPSGLTFAASGSAKGIKTSLTTTAAGQVVQAIYRSADDLWYLK